MTWAERWQERAAIAEHHGRLGREAAEALALAEVGGTLASFTGTRQGCQYAQLATVRRILGSPKLRIVRLVHGGALGADSQAHAAAVELGIEVHVRPTRDARWPGAAVVHPVAPPLDRNPLIVADGPGLLIACPAEVDEQPRGGTWATVRAARRQGVDVLLVLPDGSTRSERNRPRGG